LLIDPKNREKCIFERMTCNEFLCGYIAGLHNKAYRRDGSYLNVAYWIRISEYGEQVSLVIGRVIY